MTGDFNRSSIILLLCVAALAGCRGVDSGQSEKRSTMTGVAMATKVCSMCHGVTGESTSPMFPKLDGQQREYLIQQLTDFKGHARSDESGTQYMWGFTHLTDTQIGELADYFSSQSPMKANAGTFSERGELIFHKGLPESGVIQCNSCHGAEGQGNAQFPRLAGQHGNYLIRQIKVFQLTEQRPRGALMKQVTHALSDADAAAVAHYIATLGAKK
ncbi:MAG: c-type cytochrome [Negativicutes bacterium]|nr:c-type cytochrome [Negativicutes bacterium]